MAKRVIVAGAIETHPLYGAGNTWAFLQYVLGFRRLGFETYYVEQLDPQACVDDNANPVSFSASANVRHFRALMENFDLLGHWQFARVGRFRLRRAIAGGS